MEDWIARHKAEMIEDIKSLVEIPSVAKSQEKTSSAEDFPFGRECKRAGERMRQMAEKYGFWTEDCGGRCVRIQYEKAEGLSPDRIEIWNHLDVVPEGEGWVYPPYKCTLKGDFLIGRGVSDNKGPAVAVLYALRYLKERGIRLHYQLSQVCGLSEETGMEDAAWYVKQYGSPKLAVISDCRFPLCYGEKGRCRMKFLYEGELPHIEALGAGLVSNSVADTARLVLRGQQESFPAKGLGEKTAWGELSGNMTVKYRDGKLHLTAKGIGGHAAAPEKCVNPIGILSDFVEREESLLLTKEERSFFGFLKKSCSDGYGQGLDIAVEDKVFGKMSCAGTLLCFDGKRASLEFDLRFPPKTDINGMIEKMERQAKPFGWRLSESNVKKGYVHDPDTQEMKILLNAYRQVYGEAGQPYVMGGNTYAGFFENAVGFGPGIPRTPLFDFRHEKALEALKLPKGHGGGHACDEVQSLQGLCDAVRVYVTALLALEQKTGEE